MLKGYNLTCLQNTHYHTTSTSIPPPQSLGALCTFTVRVSKPRKKNPDILGISWEIQNLCNTPRWQVGCTVSFLKSELLHLSHCGL